MAYVPLSNTPLVTNAPTTSAPVGGAYINRAFGVLDAIKAGYVDVRDYAGWDLTGTGVSAVDAALNQAITDAIAAKVPVRIPSGTFLLSGPVYCGPPGTGVTIIGNGGVYVAPLGSAPLFNRPLAAGPNTIFITSAGTFPAFSICGTRGVTLKDFGIVGLNVAPITAPAQSDNKSDYITSGCRDAQYSPYCGIAIDAFNTAVPADGGYPGLSSVYTSYFATYGTQASSDTLIDNVSIMQFVVGVAHTPSGLGGLSDAVTFRNCLVRDCDTAYVTAQSEAKVTFMDGGQWGANCRQGFDGVNYGLQTGGCPPYLLRVEVGGNARIFVMSDANGPMALDHCYGEQFTTMGQWGISGSAGRDPLIVTGGAYYFAGNFGPTPPLQLESYGVAVFKGVRIAFNALAGSVRAWNFVADSDPISFEQCSFDGNTVTQGLPPFIGVSSNGSSFPGVKLLNCYLSSANSNPRGLDDYIADLSLLQSGGRYSPTAQSTLVSYTNGTYLYTPGNGSGIFNVGVTSLTLQNGSTSTATATASAANIAITNSSGLYSVGANVTFATALGNITALLDYYVVASTSTTIQISATKGGSAITPTVSGTLTATLNTLTFTVSSSVLQVGDILFWKMLRQGYSTAQRYVPGLIVASIVSNVVTCNMMWVNTAYDTVANQQSTTNVYAPMPQWAPTASITATATNGSPNLTVVSSTTANFNGDWLAADTAGSPGVNVLPSNARIVSGQGTATLVMNANYTGSTGTVRLYWGGLGAITVSRSW